MRAFLTHVFRFLFTATKVVVVCKAVVVVAVFIAVSIAFYSKYQNNLEICRGSSAKLQVRVLSSAAELFKLQYGRYPTQVEGVAVLKRFLSKDVPTDPWNRPYVYRYSGQHGPRPDIICYGADGVEGGEGLDAEMTSEVKAPD